MDIHERGWGGIVSRNILENHIKLKIHCKVVYSKYYKNILLVDALRKRSLMVAPSPSSG